MRAAILGALGAGGLTVGCGGLVVFEEDGAGGSGTTSQTATTGTKGTTSGQTGITTATSATTGMTTGGGCSTPISATAIPPPLAGPCSGFPAAQYICFPKVPDGPACTALYSEACVLDAYSCGFTEVGSVSCPDPGATECCFLVSGDCPVGRPFYVGGFARLAPVTEAAGWTDADDRAVMPIVDGLDAKSREALAAFWTHEGQTEHASVASFSRFVLQLLALGAPADLVRDATRATADEVEHARIAFSFASAYAGRPVGPTELDVSGALEGIADRTAAAVSIASEGCIAETVSALLVRAAAEEASDPAVRSSLRKIADEEMEHALLAWRALGFLLASGDDAMRAAVADVFERSTSHIGLGPVIDAPGNASLMRAHGYLPLAERRIRATEVLVTVVSPCARVLLQGLTLCQLASPRSQATKNSVAVLPSDAVTSSPRTP